MTTLSLLVVEIVTNALKHAFSSGRGTITLRLEAPQHGRLRLTVADDGRGLADGFDPSAIGFRIVQSLAAQLDAVVDVASDTNPSGTRVRVEFPAA